MGLTSASLTSGRHMTTKFSTASQGQTGPEKQSRSLRQQSGQQFQIAELPKPCEALPEAPRLYHVLALAGVQLRVHECRVLRWANYPQVRVLLRNRNMSHKRDGRSTLKRQAYRHRQRAAVPTLLPTNPRKSRGRRPRSPGLRASRRGA